VPNFLVHPFLHRKRCSSHVARTPEAVATARHEVRSRFKASEAGSLRSVQTWCSQLMRRLPRGRRQPGWGGVSSLAAQQVEKTEVAGTYAWLETVMQYVGFWKNAV